MRQHQASIVIEARARGLVEITGQVADVVHGTGIRQGLLTLFVRHTSASLLIQESAHLLGE
jgi:thiamine phosphate synthase YjbQ (UPF0047 family)